MAKIKTMTKAAAPVADIDNLTWDDWSAKQCSIENGPDCVACEG